MLTQQPACTAQVDEQGTTRSVTVAGEVDIATVDELREALEAAMAPGAETVVLDLADVTFLDSGAVHVVTRAAGRAEEIGLRFVVLPAPPAVHAVFTACGADRLPFVWA